MPPLIDGANIQLLLNTSEGIMTIKKILLLNLLNFFMLPLQPILFVQLNNAHFSTYASQNNKISRPSFTITPFITTTTKQYPSYNHTAQEHHQIPILLQQQTHHTYKFPQEEFSNNSLTNLKTKLTKHNQNTPWNQRRLQAYNFAQQQKNYKPLYSCILQEFSDIYTATQTLKTINHQQFEQAEFFLDSCFEKASKSSINNMFDYSDLAFIFVDTALKGARLIQKATIATVKGACQGVQQSAKELYNLLNGTTLCHIAQAIPQLTQQILKECNDQAILEQAISCKDQASKTFVDTYIEKTKLQQQRLNQAIYAKLEHLKTLSWDELLEDGTALGAQLITDLLLFHAGTELIEHQITPWVHEIASVFEQEAIAERYCLEVAGIAKAVGQDEFIATEFETLYFEQALQEAKIKPTTIGQKLVEQPTKYKIRYITPEKERVLFPDGYVKKFIEHAFSDDHKRKGLLNFGKSEQELTELCQNTIQKLYDEGKLAFRSNQIQTTINEVPLEIRVYFHDDGKIGFLNLFIKNKNDRILGNRIIL